MNYIKKYQELIEFARTRFLEKPQLFEEHHILPRSLKTNSQAIITLGFLLKDINDIEETVRLKYDEHWIAHKLLIRIFDKKSIYFNIECYQSMIYAVWKLLFDKKDRKIKNNKEFKKIKEEYSLMHSQILKDGKSAFCGTTIYKTHLKKYGKEEADRLKIIRDKKRTETQRKKKLADPTYRIPKNQDPKRIHERLDKATETKRQKKLLDPNYGKFKNPEEASKNISEAHKGLKMKPESIQKAIETKRKKKLADPNYRKCKVPYSEERKKRQSELSSGKNNPMYGKSVFQRHIELYGLEEAERLKVLRVEKRRKTIELKKLEDPEYGKCKDIPKRTETKRKNKELKLQNSLNNSNLQSISTIDLDPEFSQIVNDNFNELF